MMAGRSGTDPQASPRLIMLAADFCWEQDAALRFTRLEGESIDADPLLTRAWIGKTPVELGLEIEPGGEWTTPRGRAGGTAAFRDQLVCGTGPDGTRRYFRVSGEPLADAGGRVCGYRGVGREVTGEQRRQEELLQFRAAIDASRDMIYIVDRETMRFVWVNQTACDQVGYDSREELLQVPPHELLLMDPEQLARSYDEVIEAGGLTSRTPSTTRDGLRTVVELHRRAIHQNGRWLIVSMVHDISERVRAERARDRMARLYAALSATNEAILRASTPEELYQQVSNAAVDGGKLALAAVLLADVSQGESGVVASAGASRAMVARLEISLDPSGDNAGLASRAFHSRATCVSNDYQEDAVSRPWRGEASSHRIRSVAAVPLARGDRCAGVLIFASREKHHFDRDGVALIRRMAQNLAFALDNFEHEAARKRGEERIQYLATHDMLTGLPNRTLFNQVLAMAVESARRYRRGFAVLFIDLDRFKIINDSLGHDAGDALLREMARRLRHCLRASDVVARIGGDEFVALIQEAADDQVMAVVARKILAAAMEPVEILGQECRVTASIGIAKFPDHASDGPAVLKNADMAMYQAKEDGKNNFRLYSPDIRARSRERVAIETQLRHAREKGELSLAYQAKTSLTTGRITGVEALLRWYNPGLGEVTPTRLIPVAEETGLIIPIGRWVLETACAQNMAWQREGLRPVSMAVNLSPVQFADPGLAEHVEAVLRDTGMGPELLELEITESVVMHDTRRAAGILKSLKELGVRIAIDDFGTGYASLAQLRQFPIDSLKVDRSFIRELADNAGDRSIARAIIAMGRNLSLTVIAEGVETPEQQEFLRSQACDEMQGFYFSHPVPPEAFGRLLRDSSAADPG